MMKELLLNSYYMDDKSTRMYQVRKGVAPPETLEMPIEHGRGWLRKDMTSGQSHGLGWKPLKDPWLASLSELGHSQTITSGWTFGWRSGDSVTHKVWNQQWGSGNPAEMACRHWQSDGCGPLWTLTLSSPHVDHMVKWQGRWNWVRGSIWTYRLSPICPLLFMSRLPYQSLSHFWRINYLFWVQLIISGLITGLMSRR